MHISSQLMSSSPAHDGCFLSSISNICSTICLRVASGAMFRLGIKTPPKTFLKMA